MKSEVYVFLIKELYKMSKKIEVENMDNLDKLIRCLEGDVAFDQRNPYLCVSGTIRNRLTDWRKKGLFFGGGDLWGWDGSLFPRVGFLIMRLVMIKNGFLISGR